MLGFREIAHRFLTKKATREVLKRFLLVLSKERTFIIYVVKRRNL